MNITVDQVTQALMRRSQTSRPAYLQLMQQQHLLRRARLKLAPANQAHGYAALPSSDKIAIRSAPVPMLAIVSSYNDVLSAHQPFATYPDIIKDEVRKHAAVAQFAGGVPAMCDGVTQGAPGMDLSLFSRDVIAMSTAIALSHDLYDGVALLGICDKIVPGMLIGALRFGHLPTLFIPAGPMSSGLSNTAKGKVRKDFAQGLVDEAGLLESEMAAYHDKGTCTFYGTANSNQLLLEVMGLMLPGSAFVHPDSPLREPLTRQASAQLSKLASDAAPETSLAHIVNEKTIVNAIVALLATGGSTNHTMHWVAIARAAGILLTWDDIDQLARVVPTIVQMYPNGAADVNEFHAVGGIGLTIRNLLDAGLLHEGVMTIAGQGLNRYATDTSRSIEHTAYDVIRTCQDGFYPEGGIRQLSGNLGKAVIKVSAVASEHRVVRAPARVFDSQHAVIEAFKADQINMDCVVVVRGQGPRACGMPELHKLTPALSVLLDRGYLVALVTDGRMSGASGKVPAAIHCSPEAADGGGIAKLRDGDWIELNCNTGELTALVEPTIWATRLCESNPHAPLGCGRELFQVMRNNVSSADQGASIFSFN